MASQNVLILTSRTGGGHQSAAYALENSFVTIDPGRVLVKIAQVLEDATYITGKMADLYNFLLRERQDLMKYFFWAVNHLKPNESEFIFKTAMGYGLRLFDRIRPSVLVSVHPMTQHFFAYILKRLHLSDKIPLITVVTDPYAGFWKGWACDDVARYYVASDDARQQLIDYGVAAHKIEVAGMPVHSKFKPANPAEKRALREALGLDPEKFTVFMNAGWIGGGNIPLIYEALIRNSQHEDLGIQTVFLSGRNQELFRQAQEMAQSARFPVKVLGYTEQIDHLMKASDVMVSKLGGLTTFEAMSCRLPIIADTVTPPMPQEAQTAAFLKKTGTGILLQNPDHVVSVLRSLIDSPDRYGSLLEAVAKHGRPGASDQIARDVLRYLD